MDCSKTIWILATNALDPTIMEFCKQNNKAIFLDNDPSQLSSLMKTLGKDLRAVFKDRFEVGFPSNLSRHYFTDTTISPSPHSPAVSRPFFHFFPSLEGSKPLSPTNMSWNSPTAYAVPFLSPSTKTNSYSEMCTYGSEETPLSVAP